MSPGPGGNLAVKSDVATSIHQHSHRSSPLWINASGIRGQTAVLPIDRIAFALRGGCPGTAVRLHEPAAFQMRKREDKVVFHGLMRLRCQGNQRASANRDLYQLVMFPVRSRTISYCTRYPLPVDSTYRLRPAVPIVLPTCTFRPARRHSLRNIVRRSPYRSHFPVGHGGPAANDVWSRMRRPRPASPPWTAHAPKQGIEVPLLLENEDGACQAPSAV